VDDQPPQVSADGVKLLCDGRGFLRVAHPLPSRDPELKYEFGRGTVRIVEKLRAEAFDSFSRWPCLPQASKMFEPTEIAARRI